jgi:outer membrane protein assembly factor BamB
LNLAGIATPWVAGDWIFVVTDDAKVMAIARASGKIRWITQLPAFHNPKSKNGPISYTGPILAGGRLIVGSSEGAIIFVEPDHGAVQGQTNLKVGVTLPPVVANNMLYVLDDDGRLHAFR